MINYLIINKLGTVIYQSAQVKKINSNTGSINDSQRIRYLPLLVIKDLIKANLNNSMQYTKIGNKLVAFKEQQGLLYVACTKKRNVPVNLLQLHLKVMHHFIKFHYGPQWSLHIQGNARSSSKQVTITSKEISTCLSQLPFLSSSGKLSIRSCDNLCASEQVQVSEDLRSKLIENMISSCNSAYIHQYHGLNNHLHQHYQHHRHPFFSSRHKPSFPTSTNNTTTTSSSSIDYQDINSIVTTWAYCFLFAREKIVAHCHNHVNSSSNSDNGELSDEFVYFLKLLVTHYLHEKQESGNNYIRTTTTLPQNISSQSSSTTTTTTSTTLTAATTLVHHHNNNHNNNSAVSPSSSSNSATTANSSSHPSSLAYVYDANSTSAPFKIKEKSASSVTVVSSDSSISYWSNPLSNNLTHHLINHSSRPATLETRTPSNVLIPNHNKQQSISDILNFDGNYHHHGNNNNHSNNNNNNNNNIPFLSSSVPSESTMINAAKPTIGSYNSSNSNHSNSSHIVHHHTNYSNKISSAPSSPTRNRSRSQSFSSNNTGGNSTTTHEDFSLKHMLSNLINGESSYLDQAEDVKLLRRWVKLDGHTYLANFIIIMLSDGLCSVVICKDDPEKSLHGKSAIPSNNNKHNTTSPWKPPSNQVKQFKSILKSSLSDFTTFLLTKESTHFTNLSFAVSYPGLIHFFHLDRGVMISPLLVDLNELDKNHELLHEVYGKYYNNTSTDQCTKWKWPTELNLKRLCNHLLELGISNRDNDWAEHKVIEESKDHQYYFLYQRGSGFGGNGSTHQELLALYFGIVPPDRLWNMHQKLFQDIGQRIQQQQQQVPFVN